MTTLSKPFATADVNGHTVDLVFGEPHNTQVDSIYAHLLNYQEPVPFRGFRHKIKVTIETENILEEGVIVGRGSIRIQLDSTQAYAYLFNDIYEGLTRLPVVLQGLAAFGPLAGPGWTVEAIQENLLERKVWYRDQAAIVTEFIGAKGCVRLLPDGKEAFDPPAYLSKFGTDPSPLVDILSEEIWWYREAEE